ncbi:hypothetical protein GCM10011332_33570 [Terasakiella brassicae]|uniref:Uncharacterized protein n=1 Tax=Terasakiella brassicae TaxID=1634917 RepID=A0A917C8A6_9PROT|nr:hypothetical protein GCM10011332_33570 [Terasakiella brassicae]
MPYEMIVDHLNLNEVRDIDEEPVEWTVELLKEYREKGYVQ